jgi:hypothetical protein
VTEIELLEGARNEVFREFGELVVGGVEGGEGGHRLEALGEGVEDVALEVR